MVSLNTFNPVSWFQSSEPRDADQILSRAEQKALQRVEKKGSNLVKAITSFMGAPKFAERNFHNHLDKGQRKNALVFGAIDYYKKTIGQSSIVVKDADNEDEIATKHPVTQLTTYPNSFQDERQFLDTIINHWWLSGNVYIPIQKTVGGDPEALKPVIPTNMGILLDEYEWIRGYEHNVSGEETRFDKEDVIHLKYQAADEFDVGISPMTAAFREVQTDNEMTNHVKTLLENSAVPGLILKMAEEIVTDEETRERVEERFKQKYGGNNRGEPAFMGREDEVEKVSMDMDQLAFPDLSAIQESRILSVFGVSPILLSTTAGLEKSVFKNRKQARLEFWLDNAFDLQNRIAVGLDKQLLRPMEGEKSSLYVAWDNSEVPAVEQIQRAKKERALQEWKAGTITLNEYRGRFGMEKEEGEAGDMYKWQIDQKRFEQQEGDGIVVDMGSNSNGNIPDPSENGNGGQQEQQEKSRI